MKRITSKDHREMKARYMILNMSIESRREWLEEYRQFGPVPVIEMKQALTQENYRLKHMDEHDKNKLAMSDDLEWQKILHSEGK